MFLNTFIFWFSLLGFLFVWFFTVNVISKVFFCENTQKVLLWVFSKSTFSLNTLGLFFFFTYQLSIYVWIDTVLWLDFIVFKAHLRETFPACRFLSVNDTFHAFELNVGFLENLVENRALL